MLVYLVFEHVDQDLATYLERCPSPGLGPDRIKVSFSNSYYTIIVIFFYWVNSDSKLLITAGNLILLVMKVFCEKNLKGSPYLIYYFKRNLETFMEIHKVSVSWWKC